MHGSSSEYVERVDDGWRVGGSRVSLDSIVYAYWEGLTVEEIAIEFPSLRYEQVHGAIAFYLRSRAEVDAHLKEQDGRWEALRLRSESENASLIQRLRAARATRASGPA